MGELRRGVKQAFKRLTGSSSAFTMRDLISLAAPTSAGPAELGRIYEWYNGRTSRAITRSYIVAALALGGLLKYVKYADKVGDHQGIWDHVVIGGALFVVIALAIITGLFQHAELAQLPRELAEANRLLATFIDLRDVRVKLGTPPPDRRDGRGLRAGLATMVVFAALVAIVLWLFVNNALVWATAASIAWVVLLALLSRMWAELKPSPEPPPLEECAAQRHLPLVDPIGDFRLDDYIASSAIADYVNECIRLRQRGDRVTWRGSGPGS